MLEMYLITVWLPEKNLIRNIIHYRLKFKITKQHFILLGQFLLGTLQQRESSGPFPLNPSLRESEAAWQGAEAWLHRG